MTASLTSELFGLGHYLAEWLPYFLDGVKGHDKIDDDFTSLIELSQNREYHDWQLAVAGHVDQGRCA